jgi:hypothetical protein
MFNYLSVYRAILWSVKFEILLVFDKKVYNIVNVWLGDMEHF